MYQLYVKYFEWLCALHPSLLHGTGNKVFEVISVDDAFGDYRGKFSASGCFFRLIDPMWSVEEIGRYHFQRKEGGFVIGKKIDVRNANAAARFAVRDAVETLVNDFISHMVADSQNGHPLFSGGSDSPETLRITCQPAFTAADGSYDALICTFQFYPEINYQLSCHTSEDWQTLSPFQYD
jgi:hypothetical protein